MTDIAKRNSLKAVAATALSLAASPVANAMNSPGSSNSTSKLHAARAPSIESQQTNNALEVVITNHDSNPMAITDISPSRIYLEQGDFRLKALVKNGPVTLAPGQHITVALSDPSRSRNTVIRHSVTSLNDVLKNNVSFTCNQPEVNFYS